MRHQTRMSVLVTEKHGGYIIEVREGTEYARVDCGHDLTVGLQMALPYLRSCVQPDPLVALIPGGAA